MNGVVVVSAGERGIVVGNGDRLVVFNGGGEGELSGAAGDGYGGDGVGIPPVVTVEAEAAAVVEESASL